MGRGIVERRLQVVAQCGGQRRLVTRLHRYRIDQRREQAFAFGMQQVAQRLHFGGQALYFAFGGFQRLARAGFGGFSIVELSARQRSGAAGAFGGTAGAFGFCFRRMNVRRVLGAFQRRVEAVLRIRQLAGAGVEQGAGEIAAALQAGLSGVPFRQFGRQTFQKFFGFG